MDTKPPPVQETVPNASLWEDFIDIYYAPSQVFARRGEGKFGLVLLALVILSAILALGTQVALSNAIAMDMQRAIESASAGGSEVPAQNLEQMRSFGRVLAVVGTIVGVPISVFLSGLVVWLLGMAFEWTATFGAAVMIATYAAFPRLIQGVLGIIQGLILDPDSVFDVSIGLARFVSREGTNPLLLAFSDRIDLFAIWIATLIAIGVHVVGRVPKAQAYLVGGIFWILGALPALIPALMRQLMG